MAGHTCVFVHPTMHGIRSAVVCGRLQPTNSPDSGGSGPRRVAHLRRHLSASGTRQTVNLETITARRSLISPGSLLLTRRSRAGNGFQAKVIGFLTVSLVCRAARCGLTRTVTRFTAN